MEELDKLLETRNVDLDAIDEENQSSSSLRGLGRESMTDSILRQDVAVPNIVKITPTYNDSRRNRRVVAAIFALFLSILSMYRFSKIEFNFSVEAKLDIDDSMEAAAGANATSLP